MDQFAAMTLRTIVGVCLGIGAALVAISVYEWLMARQRKPSEDAWADHERWTTVNPEVPTPTHQPFSYILNGILYPADRRIVTGRYIKSVWPQSRWDEQLYLEGPLNADTPDERYGDGQHFDLVTCYRRGDCPRFYTLPPAANGG